MRVPPPPCGGVGTDDDEAEDDGDGGGKLGGGGVGWGEVGGRTVEPTVGSRGGTLERATGRQHPGGLRRLGGNPGGVSVAGP